MDTLSIISSFGGPILSYIFADPVRLLIGYAICVIAPAPFLSRPILEAWTGLGAWFKGLFVK